jgi:hypothetical protein
MDLTEFRKLKTVRKDRLFAWSGKVYKLTKVREHDETREIV